MTHNGKVCCHMPPYLREIINSTSRVLPAIRSRCLNIPVPAPSEEEIISILQTMCKKEGVILPAALATNIMKKSERNLCCALLMCEASRVEQHPLDADQSVPDPFWKTCFQETARMILSKQSPKTLMEVRGRLYDVLCKNIPVEIIFKELLKELTNNCDGTLKAAAMEEAAFFEHRAHLGSKSIFHLEAFVAKFMSLYREFMDESGINLF